MKCDVDESERLTFRTIASLIGASKATRYFLDSDLSTLPTATPRQALLLAIYEPPKILEIVRSHLETETS